MERLFVRLMNARALPRMLALCVCVLGLPSLAIGLQADDFVLAQQVRSHPFDAFAFIPGGPATNELRERGLLNWSASHGLKLRLLRPLASLTHALDFALWPEAAWWMHLENVLLYAALVGLAALLYTELLGSGMAAGLAAMFYAFSPAHATPLGWISARNTILCALLGMLSVLLFVRAKPLAAACVHALALLAGEAALATVAPMLAFVLLLDGGSRRSRALRVLPHVLLCVGYLFVYARLGYGAAHGGMYLDALHNPWAVIENLVMAVPLYLHSSLIVPHAALAGLMPSGVWLLVLVACVTLALLTPWIWPALRTDKRARFFALSALGSILPLSAAMPQDRLAFFVGFGGCGLLALALSATGGAPFRGVPRALFQLHTSCAVIAFVPLCFVCRSPAVGGAPSALRSALVDAAGREAVILNVPIESAIPTLDAMVQENKPRSMRALYVGGAAYDVQRVDARTLDVHVARAWFSNMLERIARDPDEEPFAAGDIETTDVFSARVLEVDERGAPLRVRFEFIASLDDPRWLWLRLDGAHALPWVPPRIGEAQSLAAAGLLL
ncbi:MAG TPA: hypothetical protein VFN67_38635 [Polyangiales bacterium]|nr:hypothetical protein [Polyangiales bacterium]